MTKVRIRVMVVFTIITMVMSLPLMAQTVREDYVYEDLGPLESNSLQATAGIFGNDIDDYMSYTGYSSVNFENAKMFGFIGGGNEGGGKLQAGFASNFGPLYLGVWYQGNVLRIREHENGLSDTTLSPVWDETRRVVLQTTEVTTYNENWIESANQIEFLIGIAGQGIRVGFYESMSNNLHKGKATGFADNGEPEYIWDPNAAGGTGGFINNPEYEGPGTSRPTTIVDYKNGTKSYTNAADEYRDSVGYLRPYLGWGSSFALGGMTLRPAVDLGVTFYDETLIDKYSSYTTVNGKKVGVTSSIGDGYLNSYLEPFVKIGAEVDLAPSGNGVDTTFGLQYGIGVKLFANDLNPIGLNKTRNGTVSWTGSTGKQVTETLNGTLTKTNFDLDIDEQIAVSHTVDLSYTVTKSIDDKLKLGFSAGIPLWFGTETSDQYAEEHEVTKWESKLGKEYNYYTSTITRTNGDATETNYIGGGLDLGIGASYQLIANRFTVNAGISASPVSLERSVTRAKPNSVAEVVTTYREDGDGNVIEETKDITTDQQDDEVKVTDSWAQFNGAIHGGFMLFFTPAIALDMLVYVPYDSSSNFTANAATVNVMLTIKF